MCASRQSDLTDPFKKHGASTTQACMYACGFARVLFGLMGSHPMSATVSLNNGGRPIFTTSLCVWWVPRSHLESFFHTSCLGCCTYARVWLGPFCQMQRMYLESFTSVSWHEDSVLAA